MSKSSRPAKPVLNVLLVLFAIAAIALLLWLIQGEQRHSLQAAATSTPSSEETSFRLELPQKALWKNYVTVSAEAVPGTTCDLLYIPPSGESQEMSSVADENGKCSWKWKIEESHGKGNGRLIITIDGKSETHFIEIWSSF
jgi:hypothetical protein